MILKLRVIQGKPAGKTLVFRPGGDYLLGRGDECHVRFKSDWVSRQHCRIRVRGAEAVLRDLGSRNGTLVNGQLCQGECPLREGDQVQIGPLTFEVALDTARPDNAPESAELDSDVTATGGEGLDETAQRPPLPDSG